jgi:PPM family protein phosphatase
MDVATHTVSDAGSERSGSSSAVALGDTALGLVAVAHADAISSLMSADLEAAAAQLVVDLIRMHLEKSQDVRDSFTHDEQGRARVQEVLRTALSIATKEVDALARRRRSELRVTVDVVWQVAGEAFVAHVGDGRVYLLRKGLVHKLTQDHSGDELHATRELTRYLGGRTIELENLAIQLVPGDRLIVASPLLHRGLDDLAIREVATDPVPDGVTSRLLGVARANNTREDMACALAVVVGEDDQATPRHSRLETLAHIPLFTYCTERELLGIAGITRPIRYRTDSTVFREGEQGKGVYLVVAGEVAVTKDGRELTRLGPGANFGEMAMLDEPHRSATVTAVEDSELLLITRDAFFKLLKRDPTLAVKVLWNMLLRLSAHLRATSEKLSKLESQ